MNYKEWCNLKTNDPHENMFPKPTTPSEGINVLQEYLLGEDWYINYPGSSGQIITEIIGEVLRKYPSEKYNNYPFYKKLWINIKCLFTSKNIYEYY